MYAYYLIKIKGDTMQLKINEIFQSIQGEGKNTGKPSLFIRVYGCDYNCGFCDSAEASIWDRKNYIEYSEEDLINKIKTEIADSNIKNIVLTGGNPCIYDFSKIIKEFKDPSNDTAFDYPEITFEVETQASKYVDWLTMVDLITISPKFSHKQVFNHFEAFMTKVLSNHELESNPEFQLKFIVDTWSEFGGTMNDDFRSINKCFEILYRIPKNYLIDCWMKNIYIHFIESGVDYQNGNYIKKFNDLFRYYTYIAKIPEEYKGRVKLGLQLHKLLEMR